MSTIDDQARLLNIYLDDHLAGATAGSRRSVRLAEAEAESSDADALATFAADVAADFDALQNFIETLGVESSRWKAAIATVGEKLGALKLNGRVLDRSPLSTIVEIEAMQMAVRGKRSLWETLQVVMPLPTPVELDTLIARADDQLEMLADLHARRVASTFSRRPASGAGASPTTDRPPQVSHV